MTIALVSSRTDASSDSNGFVSGSLNCTGANLLTVNVAQIAGATLSDSEFNTWNSVAEGTGVFGNSDCLFYAEAAAVGASQTFTIGGASTYPAMNIAAWSGAAASGALDQVATSVGTNDEPLNLSTVTPTTDGQLLVSGLSGYFEPPGPYSVDSGFTLLESIPSNGGINWMAALAYKIQTTAQAENLTWTPQTGGNSNVVVLLTFKAGASAGNTATLAWLRA